MKKLTYLLISALAVSCACAQTSNQPLPEWRATVKVVDEAGQPIAGANATIGYNLPSTPEQSTVMGRKTGLTDTNGIFTASEHSKSVDLEFSAIKSGYYETFRSYELGFTFDPVKWNPNITLVLKRVIQPIQMYAKCVNLAIPAYDKPNGFDLMAADWVAPQGKGKNTDIIFTAHLEKRAQFDFDYKVTMSFPNVGDGIQEFTIPENEAGSGLRSPHEAPEAGYEPGLAREHNERPDQILKYDNNPKRNYFFRVRTILDEHGNVKSALYGKIYGDLMQFCYYLNPTPNDRNVEFDPKQNLLGGLKGSEVVNRP